ncbi:MAG: DJ-1/PfpI family protein [Ignavibacteria bacterium]|nr:DJ-1/PfpI family protein [Ignavibacteria bacterium]
MTITDTKTVIAKSILFILPKKDFNEVEFLTTKRILEKNECKIFIASDAGSFCEGKQGLKIKHDISFFNVNENNFSEIVFIGGSGVKEYWNDQMLHKIALKFHQKKKITAAICSAPVILAYAGILQNVEATCYPDDKPELLKNGAVYKDVNVVVRKNIITGKDAASSEEFAEAILTKLYS